MTTASPYVELLYSDLHPSAFRRTEETLRKTPAQQIEAALSTYRLLIINHAKNEIRKEITPSGKKLLAVADLASALYLKRFTTMVGPSATSAYILAYRRAVAGEVPMDLIYAMADQHAERMGKYFHETSKEAMLQGFNRMVNKGVPERVAAERALDAFGLTARQMSGFVALQPTAKTLTSIAAAPKRKMLEYIGRSIIRRLRTFAAQEEHNLDQQAQQIAWMWLQDKGKISAEATKVWLTARDERVCKICGPMHGEKVLLNDRFAMPDGSELYVPGAHVNCRCDVKLVDLPSAVGKSAQFEQIHPRDRGGRFTNKYDAQLRTKPLTDTSQAQEFLDRTSDFRRLFRPLEPIAEKEEQILPELDLSGEASVVDLSSYSLPSLPTVNLTQEKQEKPAEVDLSQTEKAPEVDLSQPQVLPEVDLSETTTPRAVDLSQPGQMPQLDLSSTVLNPEPLFRVPGSIPVPGEQELWGVSTVNDPSAQYANARFSTKPEDAVAEAHWERRVKMNQMESDLKRKYSIGVDEEGFEQLELPFTGGELLGRDSKGKVLVRADDLPSIIMGLVERDVLNHVGEDDFEEPETVLVDAVTDHGYEDSFPVPMPILWKAMEIGPDDVHVEMQRVTQVHRDRIAQTPDAEALTLSGGFKDIGHDSYFDEDGYPAIPVRDMAPQDVKDRFFRGYGLD